MRIILVTPAPPGSRKGNRITALRWAAILRQLGHRVAIRQIYQGEPCDLLIALHARRSFAAVELFRRAHPDLPVIVALTGTDLYDEIRTSREAQQVLDWATRLIVLQPLGIEELPGRLRGKTRTIYQSMPLLERLPTPSKNGFQVCVMGHLRPVKDPFRTALASRLLPESSRIQIKHVGSALSADMATAARREQASNPRYRWLGDLARWKALRVLAQSKLLVLTSILEGGANVVTEAIAASVPVISSRIPGSMGMLGADYPGYFPVGDTQALAELLRRVETDSRFYKTLEAKCRRLRPLIRPERERESWRRLLRELSL